LLLALAVGVASAPGTAGCGPAAEAPARPIVAVSVVPYAWLVERVAGNLVECVVMIPPGASPATHEPTLAERRALERAALYVKVGHSHFPFERAWLDRLLEERPDLPVVDGSPGPERIEDDPHVWVSPARMAETARAVADALVARLPEHAEALRVGESAVLAEIAATEERVRVTLAPARGRTFVVLHPAWGHLAREYGLVQLAIQHGNREPDARRLSEVIERSRALGVEVIFGQPHFDPAGARVVAEAIGARVEILDPLARDWPANLTHVAERLAAEARG
jgi:zinc transport system substrate-binding protein